ncbi:BAR adaptor protein Hob1 [Coemansia sp. Benny D115]|nr:BAR adaptor protein Hob1 [Coemansia sp. Benny D115]
MSWKGFKKALERMPHQLQSKIGRGAKTVDSDFEDLKARFIELENDTKELFNNTAKFRDSMRGMLIYQTTYLEQTLAIYRPISTDPEGTAQPVGSYVDEGASPELLRVAEEFHRRVLAIKNNVDPQLAALDVSVVGPIQELMAMMRNVHKVIVKREHKLVDYDRHKAAVEKAEAKEGSEGHRRLPEEKAYQKHTVQYQEASRQYNYYNDMLKAELKQLLDMRQAFIDPIFIKFFRIQHQLYSSLFNEFSSAARNCPAFDLTTPVIVGWQQKWARAEQNLGTIDLWGNGGMTVAPLTLEVGGKSMMDTVRNTFKKKDRADTPSASSVFSGGGPPPVQKTDTYGTVGPYGSQHRSSVDSAASAGPYGQQPAGPYGAQQPPPPQQHPNPYIAHAQQQQPPPAGSPYGAPPAGPPYGSPAGPSAAGPSNPPMQAKQSPYAYGPGSNPPALGPEKVPYPPPPQPAANNGVQFVEALYDYAAQADGDLSFKEGDRIELIKRTEAKDDWWTGRLRGVVGVFPGTYVTDPK